MNNKTAAVNRKLIIACASFVALVVIVAITVFAMSSGDTILKGISSGTLNLSGMTVDEASKAIKQEVGSKAKDKLHIDAEGDYFSVTYPELGVSFDSVSTAENAYEIGHSGFFSSIAPCLKSLFGGKVSIKYEVSIDSDIFQDVMSAHTNYDPKVEATYKLSDYAIVVTNGESAYTINPVTSKNTVLEAMQNLNFGKLAFAKEDMAPLPFDLDELINSSSMVKAIDATYKKVDGNIVVTPGYNYIYFNEKEAQAIINSHRKAHETYNIPAEIVLAKHTKEELTKALFRDSLGSFSTSYSSSNANRSSNIALAASKINGKIYMPGESFSYNGAVGKRTPEAGFLLAGAYVNGETVQEYGGGICQVSSTLYNAVLYSNLEVVKRTCHMFTVGYVPLGRDATVDWGNIDFVFRNNTDYPIKVIAHTTPDKNVCIEIRGTKTENFEVVMETSTASSIPYNTQTKVVDWLKPGKIKVESKGVNGVTCSTYRIVKVDGQEVSRKFESKSYYQPKDEIIDVGDSTKSTFSSQAAPGSSTAHSSQATPPKTSQSTTSSPASSQPSSSPSTQATTQAPQAEVPSTTTVSPAPETQTPEAQAPEPQSPVATSQDSSQTQGGSGTSPSSSGSETSNPVSAENQAAE
ncbi:MAG: VanW family protein [Bacillota bacterium]|nr:VanW family protein [Bacillota bacterium]